MFKKDTIIGFICGIMTYFVLSIIGLESILVKVVISVILLITYLAIQSQRKKIKA